MINQSAFRNILILLFLLFSQFPTYGFQPPDSTLRIESNWNFSGFANYMNRQEFNNIDIEDKPIINAGGYIVHKSGLYGGVVANQIISKLSKFQNYELDLGYEREIQKGFRMSLDYSYYNYSNDSIIEIAKLNHSVNIGSLIFAEPLFFTLNAGSYFRKERLDYVSFSTNYLFQTSDFSFIPSFEASAIIFDYETYCIFSVNTDIRFNLSENFTIGIKPQYIWSSNENPNIYKGNFLLTLGINFNTSGISDVFEDEIDRLR